MGHKQHQTCEDRKLELSAPTGLEASTFRLDAASDSDEYVLFSFPWPALALPDGLTASEAEVVRYVVEGRSNLEIARARGTSPNTVANQLRTIYLKLGVSGRLELVHRCTARSGPEPAAPQAGMRRA